MSDNTELASSKPHTSTPFSEEIRRCIALLEDLTTNPDLTAQLSGDERVALTMAAGRFSRPLKADLHKRDKAIRKARRWRLVNEDRSARASTGIREARLAPVFQAPQI